LSSPAPRPPRRRIWPDCAKSDPAGAERHTYKEKIEPTVPEEERGFVHRKSEQLKTAFRETLKNAIGITQGLLALTSLYVGVIVIEVLALPLLVLWGLWRLADIWTGTGLCPSPAVG